MRSALSAWFALRITAQQWHGGDLAIMDELVAQGYPVKVVNRSGNVNEPLAPRGNRPATVAAPTPEKDKSRPPVPRPRLTGLL